MQSLAFRRIPSNDCAKRTHMDSAASLRDYLQALEEAESETRAEEWTDAIALWERVVKVNPVVGAYWQELGLTRYRLRKYEGAIAAFEKALDLRAGFPWEIAYRMACCYAQLGQRQQALAWVQRSLALGLRDLRRAQTEADLEPLRNDQSFKDLVALVDTDTMHRDDGWRHDLGLLVREIRRLHYDPFRKVSQEEFDGHVRTLHSAIPELTDGQILVGLRRLLCMAGDGHTGVVSVERPELRAAVPIQFYFFLEGLFIIAAGPQHVDLLGAQVLQVGNRPLDEVATVLRQITSHDNEMGLVHSIACELRYPIILHSLGLVADPDRLPLVLRDRSGEIRQVTIMSDARVPSIRERLPDDWISVPQRAPEPLPLYLRHAEKHYWFEHSPETGTLYMQFNSIRNDATETLDAFCERLFRFVDEHPLTKFVLDLRWNNGGNTFLIQPLIHGLIRSDRINRLGTFFVIIGRKTFSAAQNTASLIERNTKAIFVGEPTGSSPNFIGETVLLTLPFSRITVSISDLYWQHSWPEDYRTWIAPQIYAPPSFEAYRSNRDVAMDAIQGYPTPQDTNPSRA